MTIEDVIKSLAKDINGENFMLQVVFDRHINEIEEMKAQGFAYRRMMDLLNSEIDNEIKATHFKNLIFRAKKKNNGQKTFNSIQRAISTRAITKNLHIEAKEISPVEAQKDSEYQKRHSIVEWQSLTGNQNINDRLVTRLEKHGISPEDLLKLGFAAPTMIARHLDTLDAINKKRKLES